MYNCILFITLSKLLKCRRKSIMKHLKAKTILAILYMLAAGLLAFLIIMFLYAAFELDDDFDESSQKLQSLTNIYDDMVTDFFDADTSFQEALVVPARLSSSAIRASGAELKPGPFGPGFIVELTGDGSGRPEGLPEIPLTDDDIRDAIESDLPTAIFLNDNGDWLIADMISGDYCYLEYLPGDTVNDTFNYGIEINNALETLAGSSSFDYILMGGDKEISENGDHHVYNGTGAFQEIKSSGELGLNDKDFKSGKQLAVYYNSHLYLGRVYSPKSESGASYYALMLIPLKSVMHRALEQTAAQLFLTFIIWIALSVWTISIYKLLRDKKLTQEECRIYDPVSVRRKIAVYIIASSLLICISTAFYESLENLFMNTSNASSSLSSYYDKLDSEKTAVKEQRKLVDEWYEKNARRVAGLIDGNRDLQNRKFLQEASDIMGAEYIMIYDPEGRETISNSNYRGMILGTDESSATYDFRRLLRGVNYISHTSVKDEVTGLVRDLYGISLVYNSNAKAYGAMIIAVDPATKSLQVVTDKSELADTITSDNELCLGVDPDTGDIVVTSDKSLAGMNMKEIGMSEIPLTSTFMGSMYIDGTEYYGISSQYRNDDLIYYYATDRSTLHDDTWKFALISTIVFLILTILLAMILLAGFNREVFDKLSVVEASENVSADNKRQEKAWWDIFSLFVSNSSPARKALTSVQLLLFAGLVFISISLFKARTIDNRSDTVIAFIAQRRWEYGLNAFAIAAVIYTLCALIAILALLRFLSMLFASFMSERSKTICLLITNTLHYTSLVVFIFIALGFLGVNTRAILTSVSLAGLALTLGAQGFIADILAGFTVLTDGTYQVGDIVEIGGFRGEVSRLGMRSTTVVGQGKNVRTFRNSTIGDVTNFSRMNSWYGLSLTIPSSVSLDELEVILNEELPKVAQQSSKIISGPQYRGVESINGDKTTILILTECDQDDYNSVSRLVNREVLRIFRQHDIQMF